MRQTRQKLAHATMDTVLACFTCFALFLSLHLITILIFSKKEGKAKLPPSPPSLPFIGHLHHLKKPLHHSLARLSARHGPILLLKLGRRRALVVSSACLAEECFTTNDHAFSNRPHLPSSSINSYNHTIFPFANYGTAWRDMRRVAVAEILAAHRLPYFSDVRTEEVRFLARTLFRQHSASASEEAGFQRVELRQILFGVALNVMMRTMVGKRYFGEEKEDGVAQRFMELVAELLSVTGASNVGDFLPAPVGWLALLGIRRKLKKLQGYRDAFMQAIVEEHRIRKARAVEGRKEAGEEIEESNNSGKQKTLIEAMLSLQKEQPELYTDLYIKSLLLGLLSGGTDTISNTMEWTMSLLLNNPENLEKAREEIMEKVGEKRLVEESDLNNLPYLHCIIQETLRMYPAGPVIPHESMQECKVGGYVIPPRTILLVNAYAIQRDPKIWPDGSKFLPERFLHDSNLQFVRTMLPFGKGRRGCPGEGLAMREMELTLGTLLQCFEWRRIGAEKVGMEEGSGLSLPKAKPLKALFKPRESMLNVLCLL
ncbi:hypothetical protein HPP92_011614 [Vanilla planifolia]|uniref:Cytochrome P450 n=1 Tax=Vanilla planifolia TaxID=51239 RepID=A0A835QW08_VANPL|nr:hypothetical protein HPP92_011614 [Vanilla planifolia]